MVKLKRAERQYWHKPFWGLDSAVPDVQVGEGAAWVAMSVASGFTPDASWSPPTGFSANAATWCQVLLAGPDATSNPVGTVVVTTTSRIRTRVTAGDEIDIQPDGPDEWIHLVS